MKRITTLLLVIGALTWATDGVAQMSKSEKKVWKKRIKQLEPEQYKALIDDNKSLKGQMNSLQTELSGVDQTIADKDDQIEQLQSQVSDLRAEVNNAKAQAQRAVAEVRQEQPRQNTQKGTQVNDQVGVVFKVQIGAFKKKDLSKYKNAGSNFTADKNADGLQTYALGVFRDYWDADTFKKYLREMGVKDAFIASYKDGKRVPIKEVLESVGNRS
ncbi:MAG: Ezrin/radixin/moesin family protein [Cyclobacteriaceae bacterium]